MRTVTVRLPKELAATISELASVNGVTVNSLITATCVQQAQLFETYDRKPVSDWTDHPAYEGWQRLIGAARELDAHRRRRAPRPADG